MHFAIGKLFLEENRQVFLVPGKSATAVAEWYRYRIVACLVTSSSPVPLKTHRIFGKQIVLNPNGFKGKRDYSPEERKIIIKLRNEGKTLREIGKIVVRKKPHILAVNRQKHLDFANEHVNKPLQFWEKVLFSDESKFCIFGIKRRKLVWQKQGTALEKKSLVPTVTQGGGDVMVWGCMGANGVGRLNFIDSTLNHINILKENLKQSAQDLYPGDDFCFQQDNNPKHTANDVEL
ncbi:transposable element Tc1 transposase [Trichonephila clavipes]|uniref:Transposable element Tc1 transposase n=1 Tax=Trichonephila clavipes TaxID=2585209 RepID=A0A8X7BA42_TRICX|nr:transposable element Tc1 transposase [Trichonephila clavipes]